MLSSIPTITANGDILHTSLEAAKWREFEYGHKTNQERFQTERNQAAKQAMTARTKKLGV